MFEESLQCPICNVKGLTKNNVNIHVNACLEKSQTEIKKRKGNEIVAKNVPTPHAPRATVYDIPAPVVVDVASVVVYAPSDNKELEPSSLSSLHLFEVITRLNNKETKQNKNPNNVYYCMLTSNRNCQLLLYLIKKIFSPNFKIALLTFQMKRLFVNLPI